MSVCLSACPRTLQCIGSIAAAQARLGRVNAAAAAAVWWWEIPASHSRACCLDCCTSRPTSVS